MQINKTINYIKDNKANIIEFITNFLIHFLLIMLLEIVTKEITRYEILFIKYTLYIFLCQYIC